MARRRMLLAPYLAVGETVAGDWLWGAQSLDGGMYPGAGEGVLALTELRALHVDERTRQLTSVDRWDIDDVLVTKAPVPLMRLVMLQTQERTVS